MSVLFFQRHGKKVKLPPGKVDPVLDPDGWLQAMYAGQSRYSRELLERTESRVSPYKRTQLTNALSMIFVAFDLDHPPKTILEPRVSERYDDESCAGTLRSELMEWMRFDNPNGFRAELHKAILFGAQQGLIDPDDIELFQQRADAIVRHTDTSLITKEEWWPKGSLSGGAETAEDVQRRAVEVIEGVSGKPLRIVTHSTFMADTFNILYPSGPQAFAAAVSYEVSQMSNREWRQPDIPESGIFELAEMTEDKIAFQGRGGYAFFDPSAIQLRTDPVEHLKNEQH